MKYFKKAAPYLVGAAAVTAFYACTKIGKSAIATVQSKLPELF